jgi:hypothetical protein
MDKVPFAYSHGPSGFVPAEALRTFQSKDAAVQRLIALTTDKAAPRTEAEQAEVTRLVRRVHSANRRIRSKGWFFTREQA